LFSIASSISSLDKKFQGRILEGISELSKNPIQKIGNTQIPISGELKVNGDVD